MVGGEVWKKASITKTYWSNQSHSVHIRFLIKHGHVSKEDYFKTCFSKHFNILSMDIGKEGIFDATNKNQYTKFKILSNLYC